MSERRISKRDMSRLDAALRKLGEIAAANGRCPANAEIGHGVIPALAAAGQVEVELYGRNFRRVKLLTGPHAGAMTASPPAGWRPYAIIDRNGTQRTGFKRQTIQRALPSMPRPLTADELVRAS